MLSKWLVFAALLSLAWAQSSAPPTDPPTTLPTTSETTTPPPTANDSLSVRYIGGQATALRRNHFYCLDENMTYFPPERRNSDNTLTPIYWSIMLQFPVLAFLDIKRKANLFSRIVQLAKEGAGTPSSIDSLTVNDLCIGPVDHYRVSYYEESVLVRIYFSRVMVTPQNPQMGVSIAQFNMYFMKGFKSAASNTSDTSVQPFLGRNAIALDTIDVLNGTVTENFHPGGEGFRDQPQNDPTIRAVLISNRAGNVTVQEALAQGNRTQDFANNPRPINYSLEPGDIVFAVFGSIFLAIVGGLIILGFCIHPFFLA